VIRFRLGPAGAQGRCTGGGGEQGGGHGLGATGDDGDVGMGGGELSSLGQLLHALMRCDAPDPLP
jgi:hypothetical protein